ncbi:cyclin-J18 isoform X2 [Macadamia integrifolia]|uniref:cyclin-J18 isoform X2 n=1 Tax=Macadamia integrifolia TaxID=60698 RepID=UPI001C4E3B1F|nr:cyclin-J18 isoform X2 [Macadamia integrifolia]
MEESRMLRLRIVEFIISSSLQLGVPPIVKYTALSMFTERFYPSLKRKARFIQESDIGNWLLKPLRESNLQLFALISIWISSKLHDSCPLSVKSLKSLGDEVIKEQHFTTRDFLEAEVIFMQVLDFEIGALNISFVFLENLLVQFRELARIGELVSFEACMDIMDLLYETEETSTLFNSPRSLAASVLVASYVITVPMQQLEFPLLPWVKFVTSYNEEDIQEIVKTILEHVLKDGSVKRHNSHLILNGG